MNLERFKQKKYNPDKIFIYSTAPISMIVAEAEVEEILIDTPIKIWEKTKKLSGISNAFFFEYFEKKETAVAYKLKNVKKYDNPIELTKFGLTVPPQYFQYIEQYI